MAGAHMSTPHHARAVPRSEADNAAAMHADDSDGFGDDYGEDPGAADDDAPPAGDRQIRFTALPDDDKDLDENMGVSCDTKVRVCISQPKS